MVIDQRIEKFLARHKVMSLATVDENGVWCANLFYMYDAGKLIFFSSEDTRHIRAALSNPSVACSVAFESKVVSKLQGIQIQGTLSAVGETKYRTMFVKKFPIAATWSWNEKLWMVTIRTAKYTDNALGFGMKLYFPPKVDCK